VQVLQGGPAQNVIPLRIHHGNQVISGEAWRLFKEAYPYRDFFDFWLEASLNFSICSFDLSSFFLLRDSNTPAAAASSSSILVKMEPLSPKTDEYDFAYASDIVENNGRDPGHIVELSF
jgi:hypothetical protein